ncbi:hypothetical protein BGE01nite_01060 [Brevifollis gellanilyticus]|uniref:Uncharacterized protein n=2 Tax=Brevifollis gellanilyticus TaxID=748831 RepID=A0A512M259_9BACT|nr:hypothetical protein BGE01nite_01060 [Brevifollis gellanilyticus]
MGAAWDVVWHPLCMRPLFPLLPLYFLLSTFVQAQSAHVQPRDHALGDVHPFFHEGECFLYYLKPGGKI